MTDPNINAPTDSANPENKEKKNFDINMEVD
jgi:hypothetical protein